MTDSALRRTVRADVDAVLERLSTALTAEGLGGALHPRIQRHHRREDPSPSPEPGGRTRGLLTGPGPPGPRTRPEHRCPMARS